MFAGAQAKLAKSGARKKKKKSKSGGGGKQRSLLGRMAYWTLVLGLWAFIGAIGVIGWVAAHLPPIQSLEVPKRPPSIQIVGLNGRGHCSRCDRDAHFKLIAGRPASS